MSDDQRDFSGQFNTSLDEYEEAHFQQEMGDRAKDVYDFDIRGQWKAGIVQGAANGHIGDDRFKKPNHPTYSEESQYAGEHGKGGKWEYRDGEPVAFHASTANLVHTDAEDLKRYFDANEPGVKLILPTE